MKRVNRDFRKNPILRNRYASKRSPLRVSLVVIGVLTAAAVMLPGLIVSHFQHANQGDRVPYLQAGQLSSSTISASEHRNATGTVNTENQAEISPPPVEKSEIKATSQAVESGTSELQRTMVRVYVTKEKRIEKVPLEVYVRGVIAGEMPINFEFEALKAQAIAARTYIVRRLVAKDTSGVPVKGADVTDTVSNQVYVPVAKLMNYWPEDVQQANLKKLQEAVDETSGQIVTYKGEPIQAFFFSTSNGYTENSEDYWGDELPYLRSVASPWDKSISTSYEKKTELKLSDFYQMLGIKSKSDSPSIRVLATTEGHRIKEVMIGNKRMSGREVREKLALASSEFTWKISGDKIIFTTYGYGHGVGMSQWGADGMAAAGSSSDQIIAHYYTGTRIEKLLKLPAMNS